MVYFNRDREYVYKYDVSYKKDELDKILMMLVLECGEIKLGKFTSDNPYLFKDKYMYYTKESRIGVMEYEFEIRDNYLIEYMQFIPLELANILDDFINVKSMKLMDIVTDKIGVDCINIVDRLVGEKEELINRLMDLLKDSNASSYMREDLLDKIKRYEEMIKKNMNRKSENEYIDKIKECFVFEYIDKISIDEYDRVTSFMNGKVLVRKR